MQRRTFLAGAAAAARLATPLARPAVAANPKTLIFVPQSQPDQPRSGVDHRHRHPQLLADGV